MQQIKIFSFLLINDLNVLHRAANNTLLIKTTLVKKHLDLNQICSNCLKQLYDMPQ